VVAVNPNLDCIYATLHDFVRLALYQDCALQDARVAASVLAILTA
jgi:capsid protein